MMRCVRAKPLYWNKAVKPFFAHSLQSKIVGTCRHCGTIGRRYDNQPRRTFELEQRRLAFISRMWLHFPDLQ